MLAKYYKKKQRNATKILVDAIKIYLKKKIIESVNMLANDIQMFYRE